MQWREQGLVLGARRQGESAVVLELFARGRGRWRGLVHGGGGRSLRPVLQPGNQVEAVWRARLDEQLGAFAVEPVKARAAFYLNDAFALRGVSCLCALLRLLPERAPDAQLYDAAVALADGLGAGAGAPAAMARFELALLAALGFGLDLSACALTGAQEELAYVSPRSGRAVARGVGAPWRERLLPLPEFLLDPRILAPPVADSLAAFRLTGHFLGREVLAPRGQAWPPARSLFLAMLERSAAT